LIIYADEGQISQILINLIKNALQAGAKHIDITARMGKDDEVIVQVANDGEPIPVSAQEQIFIPFYTTKKEGSGIGLSISRQIMRNHNGSIELLRSDAAGTVFELRFR
jgi:signal transduction histidine kinase